MTLPGIAPAFAPATSWSASTTSRRRAWPRWSARCSAAASGRTRPTPSCGQSPHSDDLKGAAPLDIQVILEPTDRSINQGLRFIALVYLCIGIYVLFRRWTAPKSTHFYVFCLVSFVLYAFEYTGELDTFDWIIYWGNMAAEALQPALFLHFAVSFSDDYSSGSATVLRRQIVCARCSMFRESS